MIQDQELADRLIVGNTHALKIFFEKFYPSACIFANKYINNYDEVEDIVQEAFITYWNNRDQFTNLRSIKSYIYTVTRNKCLNYIKLKDIRDKIVKNELTTEDYFYEMVLEEETYNIIYQAVKKLPPQSREIILLSMKGYKNPEIAEELEISVNTVKTLKKNAYSKLRSTLNQHPFILFLIHQFLN